MEFDHRKLLLIIKRDADDCIKKCSKKPCLDDDDCAYLYRPSPPPPHSEAEMARKSLLITGCLVSSVFVLCLAFMIVKRYLSRRRNDAENRRFTERNIPILFDTQEDFVDEDHGPVVDHHVWYINTVGLPQAVIDSISVCEYKRGDGLIEGTECSVCLSEFEEDERVRLLPKCSHAFHVNCIDTWLRSHKNCPLCRAPIVCDSSAVASAAAASWTSASEQSSGELASAGDSLMENSESFGGVGVEEEGESSESSEARVEDSSFLARNSEGSRVLGEETPQPMRRSVSMDACSALAIQRAVAAGAVSCHSRSNSQLAKAAAKGSNLAALSKRVGENLSLYKLMRSSSIGISLQKRPVSMKMYCSSRHRRTQSSIIPI